MAESNESAGNPQLLRIFRDERAHCGSGLRQTGRTAAVKPVRHQLPTLE